MTETAVILSAEKHIPLNRLRISKRNVRRLNKGADKGFIQNIRQYGILQNLIVGPADEDGIHDVLAGGRRYAALMVLLKAGAITDDYPVPCREAPNGSAVAASLSENLFQRPMHPLDQFKAFSAMKKDGLTEPEIATAFGLTEHQVTQRLKLASVHSTILKAYANDQLDLKSVMAYTLADSKQEQLAVFEQLGTRQWPHAIRDAIAGQGVRSTNKLAVFVGLKAYKERGGAILSDLFEDDVYLTDRELLNELAADKLGRAAKRLTQREGWKNVEVVADVFEATRQLVRKHPEPVNPPDELVARLAEATKTLDGFDYSEEWTEAQDAEQDALLEQCSKLEKELDGYRAYTDDDKARCLCFVSIDRSGKTTIERGYVTRAQAAKQKQAANGANGEDRAGDSAWPRALLDDLGHERQQIAKTVLAAQPAVAIDLLLYTLCARTLSEPFSAVSNSPLEARFDAVQMPGERGERLREGKAGQAFAEQRSKLVTDWLAESSGADRFRAFRRLTKTQKNRLAAYCVADCLRLGLRGDDNSVVEALLADLDPDYAGLWRPTGEGVFKRLKVAILRELGQDWLGDDWLHARTKAKKGELVADLDALFNDPGKARNDAQQAISKDWLPEGFAQAS